MAKKSFNGYWTAKDGSAYVFIDRTYKAGYVTGIRYFKRDGKEIIDMQPFKRTYDEMLAEYEKGMNT